MFFVLLAAARGILARGSMLNFSPAPWTLSLHTSKKPKAALSYRLLDATGETVAQWLVPHGKARRLAPPNAFLLKAAPDLLAVCERLALSAAYWSEYDVPVGIVDELKAAILKARGGHVPDEEEGVDAELAQSQDSEQAVVLALRQRVRELEDMLYGIGAGGVGPAGPAAAPPVQAESELASEVIPVSTLGIPPGWRCVPEEPNEAMKQARRKCSRRKEVWAAMLDAAPQPPLGVEPPVAWLCPQANVEERDAWTVCEADAPGAIAVYRAGPVLRQAPAAWLATYQSRAGEQQVYVTTSREFAKDTDEIGQPQPLFLAPQIKSLTEDRVLSVLRSHGVMFEEGQNSLKDAVYAAVQAMVTEMQSVPLVKVDSIGSLEAELRLGVHQ